LEKTLKTSWGVDFDSSICLSKDTDGNIYTDEESGWYDSEGNWHMGMPFECLSGYDCASGVCINNNHRRFSCTDKNTGKEIDCGIELDEQGKPVFETRVSIAAWWNRRGDNADLEKTLYWFATPWNAPSERIKWINEEGPRDYCGLNAWISYGCKSDEFCISYNYGDDVYRHMVQHCPFAGDAPLQVNNKKVNIFSTDEVKTYNVDINGWYRAESAYFWTNENPNNLKFIKACNMTAGEDYEIIDVKSFAADSSSNDVWMMLVSKICALGTGTYEEKYECLLSYSSGFTSYGSDYAEIRTNIYKLTASEYIPGTIFKTEEGDVYSRFAANFAKNLVKINSWGDCKTNEINGKEMIQVNDFGWCLPGTTLGFAVQEIYSSGSGGYRGLNAGVSYFPSLGDREEVGVGVCWEDWYGIKCSGGAGGSEPTKVSTFETLPDAKWFYDKTIEYQKQSIMPILLACNEDLYEGGELSDVWCGIEVDGNSYYSSGWDGGNCNIIASSDSVEVWRVGFSFDTQGYGAGKYMSGGRVKFTRGFGGVEAGNEYSPHRVTEEVEGQKIYGTTSKVYNLLSQFDGRGARLLDTGAMIVVVGGNKDGVGMDPGQTNEEIKARARSIKSACPKCLVAVRIYGDLNGDYECIDPDTGEVLPDQITREECQYFYSIQKLFSDWPEGGPNGEPQSLPDSEMLALIDLLVYNAGSGRPDPREVLLNVSKNTITKYNKPGIIQAWWNEEKADPRDWDFLRNQRELTDAGLIGTYRLYWRYEDYMPPYADGLSLIDSSDSKTEQFCEFQKGTLNLLSFNIQTSYSKVYATNISDCGCQMCDAIELMTGQCNPYCADGKLCEGYVGGQKCPSGGLCARIDNCTVCSNMTGDYSCLIVTSQGEIIQGPAGQLKNLTYLFPDVVGALPNDKKCCVIDPTTLNPATFKKQSRITTGSELDIWTQRADDTTECGKVPIEGDYNWCNEIPSMPIQEGDMICY